MFHSAVNPKISMACPIACSWAPCSRALSTCVAVRGCTTLAGVALWTLGVGLGGLTLGGLEPSMLVWGAAARLPVSRTVVPPTE
jgi:hypothetical protein